MRTAFYNLFSDDPGVVIPKVYWEYFFASVFSNGIH